MLEIILILLFVVVTSSALIALKLGSRGGAPVQIVNHQLTFAFTRYSAVGIFLYGLSFLIYIYLIAKNDLGYIIPLTTALVYIVIFPVSHFLFSERFTPTKIAGIALIAAGLVFLNLQ